MHERDSNGETDSNPHTNHNFFTKPRSSDGKLALISILYLILSPQQASKTHNAKIGP